LFELCEAGYDELIKFVVDIKEEVIAVGGEMHADAEILLLENGSKQKNLWGANLLLNQKDFTKRIEFNSLINIRPRDNNKFMEIKSDEIRNKVKALAEKLLFASDESIL
jgi:hypothetical protein